MTGTWAGGTLATIFALGLLVGHAGNVLGEETQEVSIQPGWNTVLIRVDATAEQRWAFLTEAKISQIVIRSPSDPLDRSAQKFLIEGGDWNETELWVTHDGTIDARTAEHVLAPGGCVLLHSNADEARTVPLTGSLVLPRRPEWRGLAGTLVGIGAVLEKEMDIAGYFHHAPSLRHADFHMLTATSGWQLVAPEHRVETGMCLFVRTGSWSDYVAPVEIETLDNGPLEFSPDAPEQIVRLRNLTREPVEYVLNSPAVVQDSNDSVIFAWNPERAFSFEHADGAKPSSAWDPIRPEEGVHLKATGHGSVDVRIAADLTSPFKQHEGNATRPLETILWVRAASLRIPVPVTIIPAQTLHDVAGLWVGEVQVERVSLAETGELQQVPHPFPMRIIFHVSPDGECRLLSEATVTLRQDPNGTRLLTEARSSIPLAGQEESTVHQLQTIAYTTEAPVLGETLEAGTCLNPGVTATFILKLDYRHPLNPDVHAPHPDHDNLNEGYTRELEEGAEARTVVRQWTLTPGATSESRGPPFVRGDESISGQFAEKITGVHHSELSTAGRFRLRRISRAPFAEM